MNEKVKQCPIIEIKTTTPFKIETFYLDEFKNENRYNKDIFFKVLQTGLKLYFDNNTSYEKLFCAHE